MRRVSAASNREIHASIVRHNATVFMGTIICVFIVHSASYNYTIASDKFEATHTDGATRLHLSASRNLSLIFFSVHPARRQPNSVRMHIFVFLCALLALSSQ